MHVEAQKQKNSIHLLALNGCRHPQAYAHWQAETEKLNTFAQFYFAPPKRG